MRKVIETNLTLKQNEEIIDFQSRVIEVENWESFVEEMKSGASKNRRASLGALTGLSLPYKVSVENFKSDERHLSLSFVSPAGGIMKKLAYLIDE